MGQRLTQGDIDKIKAEINEREMVVRPKALADLKEARAQGDLSENFEYYAAKRFNNQNNSRIRYLQNLLKTAVVVSTDSKADEVGIDDTVTVYFEDDDEEDTYRLVTSIRSNSMQNLVSIESPIGRAIRGRKVGDRVQVRLDGGGSYYLVIRKIDKSSDSEENDQISSY
ncbi:transcription elongation factor GreA [Clostridium vitabionis]|jgi:transcription elongation factor GreA|uniref:transcription elongation factor GreA n=1 Tax=Clostridium vitabionis TaxID=2784388 RepID=UPI00188BFA95|nr:transcription elongation factor GreA [Clostridium vitabionis]